MPTLVSTGQFTIVDVNDGPITNLTPPSELTSVVANSMGGWTRFAGVLSNSSIVNNQVGPNGEYPRILRVAGDGTIVGWYGLWGYWFKVDISKAYVHYCWVRRRSATSANLYLGWTNSANYVDTLAGVNDSNPYFIPAHNPTVADKWYLCVGVIWPSGYGSGDTGLAGIYDPHTGVRVYDGAEFRHNVAATQQYIRMGVYNNVTGQASTDGYDFLPVGTYCMDGTQPTKEAIMNTVPAAMTAALSKETYVFPADNSGAVSSYTGSGTQIRVYQGAAELTYDAVGTTKGTWKIDSATGTNITVGAISDSGTFATVADHSGVAAGTDTSTIVYNISGTTLVGAPFTLVKTQTFAKAKGGAAGSNGVRTAVLDMYRWSATAPSTFPSGTSTYTWATGAFTAPGTTNSWTLVPDLPVAGQTLYIVRQIFTDTSTSATSAVTWSANTSIAYSSSGVNGQRVGILELYQWAASSPTTSPTGTSTYTWATGAFTAPSGAANGWSLTPGAPGVGQTLWAISVRISDNNTSATSTATWGSNTPYAVGYAGTNGQPGERGSKEFFASGSAWSDNTANTAITTAGLTRVLLDQVTISNGSSFAETRFWNGTAWTTISQVINGNLLVNGTVGANALVAGTVLANVFNVGDTKFKLDGGAQGAGKGSLIVTNGSANILTLGYIDASNIGLSLKDASGNIVMQTSAPAGGGAASSSYAPAISNSNITVDANGILQGAGTANVVVNNAQVRVGGTNLVPGTGTSTGWTGQTSFTAPSTFTKSNASTTLEDYVYSPYFPVNGGEEITLSFDAYNDTNVSSVEVYLLPDDYATTGLIVSNYGKYSSWTKVSLTFTSPAAWGAAKQVRLRFDHNGSTSGTTNIYVRNIKLEYGNKPTTWSLAQSETSNNNITISSGAIQGIGTGTGTTVANSSITVDGTGTLQGIGTASTVVANNQISINQSTGQISGIGTGNNQSIANNRDNIIRDPAGALSVNNPSSVSGALKIRLPQFWTSTMMRFTVDIYEYAAGLMCTMEIGGYNYSTGVAATSYWTNVTARVLGGSNVEYPVYFGHDGTKCCVWIGNSTETWSYPQVRVKDFLGGHSNSGRDLWASGWTISFDTTALASGFGTNQFTASVTDTLPGADWSKTARRPGNLSALVGTENIQNNAITIDASGILQGAGTANVVVNNGQIAVNASGQLTGIGTGNNTTVSNAQITIASGTINGIGTGNGTAVANDSVRSGGVNLVGNSGFLRHSAGNPINWGLYNNGSISATTSVLSGGLFGQNYYRIVSNAATTQQLGIYVVGNTADSVKSWLPGQTYCISFWARGGAGAIGRTMEGFYSNMGFTNGVALENPALTADWQRYVFRGIPANNANTPVGELYISWNVTGTLASGSIIEITCPKVELGSQPTSWTPSPQDTLNQNISISSGAIQGIGSGTGTMVSNNAITVDVNGILQGTGTANTVVANSQVPVGQNLCINTDFVNGMTGWVAGWDGNIGGTITRGGNLPGWFGQINVLYATRVGTPTAGTVFDAFVNETTTSGVDGFKRYAIPVLPGERLYFSWLVAGHRCSTESKIGWYDSTGTYLTETGSTSIAENGGASGGDPTTMARSGGFGTAPANARYARIWVRGVATGAADPYIFCAQPFVTKVPSNQTAVPPYSSGPADRAATLGATIGTNLSGTFNETEFNNRFTTNTISGTYIKDATISNAKIENLAVTNAKIANATIETAKIADLAVTNAKLANATITSAKIGDLEVTNAKIANLTVGTQKITDLAISRSSSSFYNFAGWSYPTNYTWYDVVSNVGTYVFVGVNQGAYDYEYVYQWPVGSYQYVYKGPGLGDYNYTVVSAGLITSVVTGSSSESGSQVVNIEAVIAIERDGGSDDNVGARVIRTNDSTVLPESYSTLRARSGKSTYALMFRDPAPIAGATNTYKVQMYNNNDDSHIYEAGMRATLFRK